MTKGQKDKKTNNRQHNTTQKTKDSTTRINIKQGRTRLLRKGLSICFYISLGCWIACTVFPILFVFLLVVCNKGCSGNGTTLTI